MKRFGSRDIQVNFYVEVYFFKKSGYYGSFRVFEGTGKLRPYVEQIDIKALLTE